MKYREKIKTRRGTIAGRNIRSLAFLGIFLIVGVCLIAGRILYERNIEVYTNYAYSDAHLIADSISGITPTKYLETQTKDAEYYDIRYTFMTAGIYQDEFRDFYLVVPTEDDLIYISEIYHNLPEGMENLSKDQADFLEHKEYRPGEKEIMMDLIKRGRGEPDRELFMGLRELAGEKLATALVPIRAMDNEVQALVGVDLSVAAVWESLMNMYIMLAITIVVITCVGMILHYRNLDRTLIQPITTLKNGTDELVNKLDSEEAFVSGIHTGDELEALAHSIEEMDRSLKHYVRENTAITAERERLNTELELAGSIQMDMLPCDFPPFPERSEFDLYASMNPAKEVGGDFYDFFLVDEDHLALVIADVSGKGIPGALFMMMVKIMVQNCVLAGLSPKQVMEQVNEQIAENNSESMFVTVWLGILDIPSGKLTAVNAGHEYPIFKKPGGCYELIKDKHGMAVGTMEGIRYREYEMQFEPGSSLFVYSDGLPEANNRAEELFGIARTLAALNENPDLPPEETLCAVERAVDTFVGDAPQFDDLTMLCFAYHGAAGRPETEERGEKENGQE
jgi:sigma-B regulation protein RsbU (phosphoserine phosphatase)